MPLAVLSDNNHSTNYTNQLRKLAHVESQSRFFPLALPGSTCFPLLVEKKIYLWFRDKSGVASRCSFLLAEAAEKLLETDALVFGAHFGLIRTVELISHLEGSRQSPRVHDQIVESRGQLSPANHHLRFYACNVLSFSLLILKSVLKHGSGTMYLARYSYATAAKMAHVRKQLQTDKYWCTWSTKSIMPIPELSITNIDWKFDAYRQ